MKGEDVWFGDLTEKFYFKGVEYMEKNNAETIFQPELQCEFSEPI